MAATKFLKLLPRSESLYAKAQSLEYGHLDLPPWNGMDESFHILILTPDEPTLERLVSALPINDTPEAAIPPTNTMKFLERPWRQHAWLLQALVMAKEAVFLYGQDK
jgi:hypothetical protein